MSDTIKVFKDKAGEYRWTKVAANGEPVATSESYTTKASAIEAANREADRTADRTHAVVKVDG